MFCGISPVKAITFNKAFIYSGKFLVEIIFLNIITIVTTFDIKD